jgi:hypothetical protein
MPFPVFDRILIAFGGPARCPTTGGGWVLRSRPHLRALLAELHRLVRLAPHWHKCTTALPALPRLHLGSSYGVVRVVASVRSGFALNRDDGYPARQAGVTSDPPVRMNGAAEPFPRRPLCAVHLYAHTSAAPAFLATKRGKGDVWTNADAAALRELSAAGISQVVAAQLLGRHPSTISVRARRAGLKWTPPPATRGGYIQISA